MNFYKHHVGDYVAATSHLTWDEDCAYRRLIEQYYKREAPIPSDLKEACRLVRASTPAQKRAVETVLREFFVVEADGWHQKRCDEEIRAASAQAQTNRRIAEERESKRRSRTGHDSSDEPRTNRSPPRLQTPDSKTPDKKEEAALAAARAVGGLDVEAFDRWLGYRSERKPPIKPASMEAAALELSAFGDQQAAVVQHSIANGYQGLFAPKTNGTKPVPAFTKFERVQQQLKEADDVEDF